MLTHQVPERRSRPRFPVAWRFEGTKLASFGLPETREEPTRGAICDISSGGLCLLTDQIIGTFQVLRCEIYPAAPAVAIPTIAEICWSLPQSESHRFMIGLRFLL